MLYPYFAVVPYAEFTRLKAAAELAEDLAAYDAGRARVAAGEELIPSRAIRRLIRGTNPLRTWRDHRQLTQGDLAKRADINQAYVSQIERGERRGTTAVLRKLATALGCDVDDLLP